MFLVRESLCFAGRKELVRVAAWQNNETWRKVVGTVRNEENGDGPILERYGAAIAALSFRRILRKIGKRCVRGWWAQQSERYSFLCYKLQLILARNSKEKGAYVEISKAKGKGAKRHRRGAGLVHLAKASVWGIKKSYHKEALLSAQKNGEKGKIQRRNEEYCWESRRNRTYLVQWLSPRNGRNSDLTSSYAL